jgi:stringent starvation protein B
MEKKNVLEALIIKGSVFIHLDPRYPNVCVPSHLAFNYQVVLQIGLDMPVPIPDLSIDNEGVYGTLSFKGVPFTCFIPYSSVFAIVGEDGRGSVWNGEVPLEVAEDIKKEKLLKELAEIDKRVSRLESKNLVMDKISKVAKLDTTKKAKKPAGSVRNNSSGRAKLKVVK